MTWVMVLEISAAMAVGFLLGRIWSQSVHDLQYVWMADYEADDSSARIPHPRSHTLARYVYFEDEPALGARRQVAQQGRSAKDRGQYRQAAGAPWNLQVKNPKAPAVKREAEENWGDSVLLERSSS